MKEYPAINRKLMKSNTGTKQAQKQAKKYYQKGKSRPLKNLLYKVVTPICNEEDKILPDNVSLENLEITKEELIKKVYEAKLTGMSGNGYPVYKKLESFGNYNGEKVCIVNAVECDPGLIHDEWIAQKYIKEISETMKFLQKVFKINKMYIAKKAFKGNKPGSIAKEEEISVCYVPARYPAGEEHNVIKNVLEIEIPKSEIPVFQGIIVMNVQTVWQIGRILKNTYDGGRYITMADIVLGKAKPVYVYEQTSVKKLLNETFSVDNLQKIYAGMGIMSVHEFNEEKEKLTSRINFIAYIPEEFTQKISNENRCKGCGACSRHCPSQIDVRKIVKLKEADINADIKMLHPEKCIHCGSCTWYCYGNKIPELYVNL